MGNKWCLSKLSVGLHLEQSGLLHRKSVKSTLGHNAIFCPCYCSNYKVGTWNLFEQVLDLKSLVQGLLTGVAQVQS